MPKLWSPCTESHIRTIGFKRKTVKSEINASMLFTKRYTLWQSVCSHVCADATRASLPYHSLTSDSCLVLWAYVCCPFRHSLIRTSALSPKSNSLSELLFRVFFSFLAAPLSPGFPLFSPSSMYCNFSRVHKTIWHFRLRWGPVGPKLAGGDFARTATPNGALGGGGGGSGGSHWILQGRWVVMWLGIKRVENFHLCK